LKAIVQSRYGSAEVLDVGDIAKPTVGDEFSSPEAFW
jgi:hypothetical protein